MWLSGRVTAKFQVLFRLFMCFRSFTPRFPPLLSPISPPLPPWAPLPSPAFSTLSLSLYLHANDFPAPFMPFDFGSPSFTRLLLSPVLFISIPLNE